MNVFFMATHLAYFLEWKIPVETMVKNSAGKTESNGWPSVMGRRSYAAMFISELCLNQKGIRALLKAWPRP